MDEINDIRNEVEFKIQTFSGFKRTNVVSELLNSLVKGKVESSCYWNIELICSGKYSDIWEVILKFYGKYVHIANPKIILYLEKKFQTFKNILKNGYIENELNLRNNIKIREIFAEIMVVLSCSPQKYVLTEVKINKEDFDITIIQDKFKAPNINYCKPVLKENDPTCLTFSVNELAYSVSNDCKSIRQASYWIEWIIQYGKMREKNKEKCLIEERDDILVSPKDKKNIVWLIWDILIYEGEQRDVVTAKMIRGMLSLFCIRYSNTINTKRRFLLYSAASLLTEKIDYTKELLNTKEKEKLTHIISNINALYKDVKANEVLPTSDNLKSNTDKIQKKLALMNDFSNKYTPRII